MASGHDRRQHNSGRFAGNSGRPALIPEMTAGRPMGRPAHAPKLEQSQEPRRVSEEPPGCRPMKLTRMALLGGRCAGRLSNSLRALDQQVPMPDAKALQTPCILSKQ
ncbi:hypothetical protein PCASD_11084 [Puccinia coronata f. sp. avenae]|uniref:Uncharacterized protein n=1 Tax=Puccinia coronata f. sp. avenae TaxID=200324 RepID=A0A2N5U0H4_9BASI|nr:hypothetical protein PCASD_25573 [Puccinia coronata f. sp. avenae]PLW31198.1 hypothetical protein PCASD_11084 [Puccinia coronata f. sp. avenae]